MPQVEQSQPGTTPSQRFSLDGPQKTASDAPAPLGSAHGPPPIRARLAAAEEVAEAVHSAVANDFLHWVDCDVQGVTIVAVAEPEVRVDPRLRVL